MFTPGVNMVVFEVVAFIQTVSEDMQSPMNGSSI